MQRDKLFSWLPNLNRQVWILGAGRLLSGIGSGFTLFYAPIFFTEEVGLTKTAVGIALGSASISGVLGRFLSGSLADSPAWGRRRTLLLSALVCAVGCFALATADNLSSLLIGNLLLWFGGGLYWPATEALIADLTNNENRQEAYALNRLADSVGLQLGVVLGGLLISLTSNYRGLFIIDGVSYLVFFGVIWVAIKESSRKNFDESTKPSMLEGWGLALRDRGLLIFALVNVLFTMYICQIQTSMPLYFKDFVSDGTAKGFSTEIITGLFTWHLFLTILFQLPVARFLGRFSHTNSLIFSAFLWGGGFLLIGLTGTLNNLPLLWAILGLAVLAMATVSYTPFASSLVVDLAPESLRGVYLSVNSLCWAIGYFIGPPLGGFMLDLPRPLADGLWLGLALSVGVAVVILKYLGWFLKRR
ncbi:MDR family MFS transporter [Ancylothrix sp. D3o]|uniref:MDR family MFS transporter n=1 Tax=Ancylothrix sp. D3o TaxID=2953691 RepID=UPI0035C896D4